MATLEEKQRRLRQRSLAQSIRELKALMSNEDGWQRLRNISPEEWAEAERRDREREQQQSG